VQMEYNRGNGFIIAPLSVPNDSDIKTKSRAKPHRLNDIFKYRNLVSSLSTDILKTFPLVLKKILYSILSVSAVVCSISIFFSYFTVGIAIYNNGTHIAFSASQQEYLGALSSAKKYAEENSTQFQTNAFTVIPTLTFKNKISKDTHLRDKLLISTKEFDNACVLYSENCEIFRAENEDIARKIVEEYVSSLSMNGKVISDSSEFYKNAVIPTKQIQSEDECRMSLINSQKIPVVSLVNSSGEKEIPFETEFLQDENLYIGETVTVQEGKNGFSEIKTETTYKNGMPQSIKVVSDNVVDEPVARIVKVGTKQKEVLKSGLYYPLEGVLSSPFGDRWGRMHEGIDIAVVVGTPVKAAECGVVIFAGDGGSYGNFVKIDHGNGVITAYAHLDSIGVSVGQSVDVNTEIAKSGNTGRSTGPHLHFEVVKDGIPLNPITYLKKR